MFTVNRNPTPGEIRKFGWGMLIGFGALDWLAVRLALLGLPLAIALLTIGVLICVICQFSPRLGRLIYIAWMTVTVPIGVAMSTVLLTVLYVLFLPVFALIVRSGDPLRRKLGGQTYWEEYKPHEPTLERMRRLF